MPETECPRCCDYCRFWNTRGKDYGECRRHPPVLMDVDVPFQDDNGLVSVWPTTNFSDWCGEYLPAESCLDCQDEKSIKAGLTSVD